MEKIVIIINGNGGVGKDTLCDFAGEKYKVSNISSITPIKELASQYGWKGEKDSKSRKFLADLKRTFIDYNNLPCEYLVEKYKEFLDGKNQILFVHIREGEEIDKFKNRVKDVRCISLLVRRKSLSNIWGNCSDDRVGDYTYDYYYDNDLPLDEAKNDFLRFLNSIISG